MKKTRTRQEAIHAKCHKCCYDEYVPGTWRAQAEACSITDCSLYEHRPLTTVTKKRLQEAKIAAMSPKELRSYRAKQESARMRLSTGKKQQDNDISGNC